ncbi:MAG: MBL fold metallo-hydrolase [Flavobacteriales bacterium]|nr:MBL fold metallo-hydrolase [Flavobacteriales bacterium]
MKITFLGTGTSSGVPMIACSCDVCRSDDSRDQRLRSSVMIEHNGQVVVVDSGPDFRQQMLNVDAARLDALLFTHEHKDHIAGMDDVRAFNFQSGKPMEVYASVRVQKALEREYHYVFHDEGYPGVPRVNMNTIHQGEAFKVADMDVLPVNVWHHKLPVMAFRFADFSYVTDANAIDDPEKEMLRDSKILVLNALRKEAHVSHFTLDEAIALGKELNAAEVYLTHISHQLGKHADVSLQLPPDVYLAYDGLQIEMPVA